MSSAAGMTMEPAMDHALGRAEWPTVGIRHVGELNYLTPASKDVSTGLLAAVSATLTVFALPAVIALNLYVVGGIFSSSAVYDVNTIRLVASLPRVFLSLLLVLPLLAATISVAHILRRKALNWLSFSVLVFNCGMVALDLVQRFHS
jgi:hypothetical protein